MPNDPEPDPPGLGPGADLSAEGDGADGPSPSYEDVPRMKRQLAAARAEVQALLDQLSDFNAMRAKAMKRGQEVEALRARLVSVESDRDQHRDLAEVRRRREAALEERLRQAREDLERLRSRAPGDDRSRELEAALEEARARRDAVEARAEALLRERDGLEERLDELTARVSEVTGDRDVALERAERTRVALERLRKAFVRSQQDRASPDAGSTAELEEALEEAREEAQAFRRRVEALEAERDEERARREAMEAELPEAPDALSAALGSEPGVSRERMVDAEQYEELQRHARKLEARAAELEQAVESAVARALEAQKDRRRTQDLEERAEELERALERESGARAHPEAAAGGDVAELQREVARLQGLIRRDAAQIQQYMLELEGSKGAVSRARRELGRYGERVDGLHEALGHLERFLRDAGPGAEHALVLLEEVKRCAAGIRSLVEGHDRLGGTMGRTLERLGGILKGEDTP